MAKINDPSQPPLTTIKCWNILKVICDYDKFVEKFLPVIEKEMIPLFKYIDRTQKVDFDEEIVLIVTSFLKISKKVTPILQQIFPQ